MEKLFYSSVPKGCEARELPALAAVKANARLEILKSVVGAQGPKAAKDAGLYLLEDKLALELKLQGLNLPKNGEVPSLSPARWPELAADDEPVPEGARGLLLEPAAVRRLRTFLRASGARGSLGALDLIHLARHFFYEEPVKIVVPTRTPV